MLPFFNSRKGTCILLKYTRLSRVSTAFASSNCPTKNNTESSRAEVKPVDQSNQSHPLYKRDLINFPRIKRLETDPPVRFGIIPKAWFDFFYEKTGVTGGYMLLLGSMVVLLSKEIIVMNGEIVQGFGYILLVVLVQKFYGPTIYSYCEKKQEETEEQLDASQEYEKDYVRNHIKNLEKSIWSNEGVTTFLSEAKRENVYLQMEIAYRERVQDQYLVVKNVLDFQVEKSSIERQALQKGLFSWVVNNVNLSITREIKDSAMRKSLEDLKNLASRSTI